MAHRPTDAQYQTLAGMGDGGWHTVRELVGEGLDYGKARRALVHLERPGKVERRDDGSNVLWRITASGRQELADEETLRIAQAALAEELAMALNWRECAVLGKLAGGDWHRPARLITAKIGYQRVQTSLHRLLELGLVERERVGSGSSRLRYQYRITEAGRLLLGNETKQ